MAINTQILKPKQEDPRYRKHLAEQVQEAEDMKGLSTDPRFIKLVLHLHDLYYQDWKLSKDKTPEERERLFLKHEVLDELVESVKRIEQEGLNAKQRLARL